MHRRCVRHACGRRAAMRGARARARQGRLVSSPEPSSGVAGAGPCRCTAGPDGLPSRKRPGAPHPEGGGDGQQECGARPLARERVPALDVLGRNPAGVVCAQRAAIRGQTASVSISLSSSGPRSGGGGGQLSDARGAGARARAVGAKGLGAHRGVPRPPSVGRRRRAANAIARLSAT